MVCLEYFYFDLCTVCSGASLSDWQVVLRLRAVCRRSVYKYRYCTGRCMLHCVLLVLLLYNCCCLCQSRQTAVALLVWLMSFQINHLFKLKLCLYVVNLQRNDDTNEVFDLLIAYMGRLQQEVSYKPNSISFAPLQVVNTSVA